MSSFDPHGTTILCVRRRGLVAMGGAGQVTIGNTVMKGNVIVTLLLPILNLAGNIYLISALLLRGLLLYAAWAVWRKGGNKVAWRMYKWSSTYLVFIFLAIMFDAVLYR